MYYAKELAPNLFNSFLDWYNNYTRCVGKCPEKEQIEEAKLYFKRKILPYTEEFAFDPDKTANRLKEIQMNMNKRLMQNSRLTVYDVLDELQNELGVENPLAYTPWTDEPITLDFKEDK